MVKFPRVFMNDGFEYICTTWFVLKEQVAIYDLDKWIFPGLVFAIRHRPRNDKLNSWTDPRLADIRLLHKAGNHCHWSIFLRDSL